MVATAVALQQEVPDSTALIFFSLFQHLATPLSKVTHNYNGTTF